MPTQVHWKKTTDLSQIPVLERDSDNSLSGIRNFIMYSKQAGVATTPAYSFYTGSKNVSGCVGSKISLHVITVTKSSISDKLIILCVHPGIM